VAIVLTTVLIVAYVALAGAGVVGYGLAYGRESFTAHFHLALVATLLGIFGHAMTMFYFIGTGKAIKDVVREQNLDKGFLSQTRRQNMIASSWATAATACLMFQFIIGGGAHTRAVPARVHEVAFFITLIVSGLASYREIRLLSEQNALADRVNELVS
jgi:hypothetical protein